MGGSSAGAGAAQLGEVLCGRYRLDQRLGEGASGVVFAAHDRTLDETVALKLVTAPSDDGTLFESVRREVKLARRVTHPNVGRIYDLGEDGGRFFLTMELVAGTSLRATLAEGTPSLGAALRITSELSAGLIAAHAAGIVHRDLKPANVILRLRDGFSARAVLTDFGIAQQVGVGACGDSAGTPAYMAPEQLLGEPIDGRTDVYALGLILFQLLVGHRPFKGDSLDVVLKRRLTERPPDPCDLAPSVPTALGSLVAWMLATERTARPDAVMVAAALERLRGGRARELTRGSSPAPRSRPPRAPLDGADEAALRRAREAVAECSLDSAREAAALLEDVGERHADHPEVLALHARALLQGCIFTGMPEEPLHRAEELALRAYALAPHDDGPQCALAAIHLELGAYSLAASAALAVLEREPRCADAHVLAARALFELNHPDDAAQHVEAAIALAPGSAEAYLDRARFAAYFEGEARTMALLDEASARFGPDTVVPLAQRLCFFWRSPTLAARTLATIESHRVGGMWEPVVPMLRMILGGPTPGRSLMAQLRARTERPIPFHRGRVMRERLVEMACLLGEHETALQLLDGMTRASACSAIWLTRCPALEPLRADPRFVEAAARLGERLHPSDLVRAAFRPAEEAEREPASTAAP